jgi:signal transduction histidine kinase
MAADPSARGAAARSARTHALVTGLEPPPGGHGNAPRARVRAAGHGVTAPGAAAAVTASADDGPRRRQRLYGRLAAVFFAGSGVLGLVTLPLPAPGSDTAATAAVFTAAVIAGAATWLAPWDKWPRWVSLVIVPAAFTLIALGNAFGGFDQHTYSLFFVVTFVWIGLAHPSRTSAAMAPLAAAAYILPLLALPGDLDAGVSSAAITIPICVLVGEGIAWGVARHDQIEIALQRERDRAEHLRELDDMKDAFLSAVSHELRTPITVCRGHLEVLADGAGAQEVLAVKETLVDELGLMGRLVDDLATLARADDPAMLRLETLAADGFLDGLTAKAQTILGGRLRTERDARAAGAPLRADPQRLTQALLNLVRNAAEHARGDGPVILRARASTPAGWRFEVADEGGGLPAGDERVVFDPFETGSSPTGGTGLGLAIVRGIARAHGGEAGVDNRPGRGATFWIGIPG